MNYYFLAAALPGVSFSKPSPMSVKEFDELCAENMSPSVTAVLHQAELLPERDPEKPLPGNRVIAGFWRYEQYLRTRCAERRAAGSLLNLPDPAEYFGEIDAAVSQAAAISDPMEREKLLDLLRWRKIDELEAGHDFDLDFFCCYRLRLAILQKYGNCDSVRGEENFNAAAERISNAGNQLNQEKGVTING